MRGQVRLAASNQESYIGAILDLLGVYSMSVNLSIKNVPDHLAEKLRSRALRNHRSLQGELMAILEKSVAATERLTPGDILARVRKMGLQTPEESATFVREDRDARSRR